LFFLLFGHMVHGQLKDILNAVTQGWELNQESVDPKQEVFSEKRLLRHGLKITVRGRDDPEIAFCLPAASQWAKAVFLEDPEEGFLEGWGELTDFIKEKGPLVRLFDQSLQRVGCSRERPFSVAEQGAFRQRGGQRGAVHYDEFSTGPRAVLVNGSSEQFLAGPCFPGDEDVSAGGCGFGDDIQASADRGPVSDNVFPSKGRFRGPDSLQSLPVLENAFEWELKFAEGKGFRYVIPRPVSNGQFRPAWIPEAGHDDDFGFRRD
jgi:hypothetical protein